MRTKKIEYRKPFSVTASMKVKNIERAAKFYTEVLGFERGWDEALDIGWLEINLPLDGFNIGLSLLRDEEIQHGSTTLNIGVQDVEATKKYLESKRVKILIQSEIPELVKTLAIADTEGNKIVFVENLLEYNT